MTWTNTPFVWPASLNTLADSTREHLNNTATSTTESGSRLAGIGHDFGASGSDVSALRMQISSLLQGDVSVLCVHPYQHGIGQGEPRALNLPAPNAVTALAKKLTDSRDSAAPGGNMAAVCGLVTAGDLGQFVNLLAAFNAVFPVPDVLMVERRARQQLQLETSKLLQPAPRIMPVWQQLTAGAFGCFTPAHELIGQQVATAEGAALDSTDPVAELQAVLADKTAHIEHTQTALTTLKETVQGSAGWWRYHEGDASTIASALPQGAPGYEWVFTVGVLFVGNPEAVQAIKELVGL